jgi:hypothetical protein
MPTGNCRALAATTTTSRDGLAGHFGDIDRFGAAHQEHLGAEVFGTPIPGSRPTGESPSTGDAISRRPDEAGGQPGGLPARPA